MSFGDELKRKKDDLDAHDRLLEQEWRRARTDAAAARQESFKEFRDLADTAIDELVRVFFEVACPKMQWGFVNEIPVTESYSPFFSTHKMLRIKYTSVTRESLRAFRVTTSPSVFVVEIGEGLHSPSYCLSLIKLSTGFREKHEELLSGDNTVVNPKGHYVIRQHLASSKLLNAFEVNKDSVEHIIKDLLLRMYEHERSAHLFPALSFWQ